MIGALIEGQEISQEKADEVYAFAYALYTQKKYQEALSFFRLLTLKKPQVEKYWRGLGSTLQLLSDFKGALACYLRCLQLLPDDKLDASLFVYAADCHFALGDKQTALATLDAAALLAKKKGLQTVLNHVSFMKRRWSEKKA